MLFRVHDRENLQVLILSEIKNLPLYFAKNICHFMGGHNANFAGSSIFKDCNSVEEWIGVFDVIFELLDQFFTGVVELSKGKSHMLSLVFLFLIF